MAPLLEPPRGQERHGKPSIFMKFHVFHGSGLFNAEAQRRRGFWGTGFSHEGTKATKVFLSVKALLGCFTRRREDAKGGGRVSPRAVHNQSC
jgi:hypothetical protein